ncbi:MAG TPA: RNA methyltransferase [Humidesulfovibrio sp.]|uniref:RNA methyltransferase n=1 Tax=Humidesulfovibrio sp. TaxID=2910988 RepID=UPI002C51C597|nr:RNA methyltransferase [Humidesulfovibrio sp.]HWR04358.1 RNA methyltransferase [Humidesulfovibrio sp.]
MPLDKLLVVLFRPKYAENVGSVARAMLNMGAAQLVLVDPQGYEMDRALPLATVHARHILEGARIVSTLAEALAGTSLVVGTTARTGGWRKGLLTPAKAAPEVLTRLHEGGSVAIVFGPEDRGLTNEETSLCDQLAMIPASPQCTSLNLSQAVLILLYECYQLALTRPFEPKGPPTERDASFEERQALFASMQEALTAIDFLKDQNAEYWMLPVRRFFSRFRLRRNEFNLLMGICRQVRGVAARAQRAAINDLPGSIDFSEK